MSASSITADQIVFGLHVVIEAHGSHLELLRHAAHRHRLKAFLVGNGERGGGDLLAGQPRLSFLTFVRCTIILFVHVRKEQY